MAITLQQFELRLKRLDAVGRTARTLRPAAVETALDAEGRAKLAVSGQKLNVRTGRLRQSIAGVARAPTGGGLEVRLKAGGRVGGKPVPYAATHEFGATIKPKRSRFLRIPLPAALTAAGVDRYASPLRQTGAGQFHVRRTDGGKLLLIHTASGRPWYTLRRQVKIPARPYLRPSLAKAGESFPGRVLTRIQDALRGRKGGAA